MIDLQISHEEFKIIVREIEKYEKMKVGIRMMKSSDKLNKEEGEKLKQQDYEWK